MITFKEFVDSGYRCILDEEPSCELMGFREEAWNILYTLVRFHEENANLIAAAPELLEALKECMEIFGNLYSDSNPQAYSKAYKAIALAEGRAQ